MVTIFSDGPVWTLDLGDNENRFSPDWLEAVERALEEVEASTDAAVLVTIGSGKYYSNGLDLEWIGQNFDQLDAYVARVQALFARVLTLPVPTIAAVNGHAFGAGSMFAIAHDWRVMREDRGYFCFPEVDINIPFTPGMTALITSKLSPRTAIDAMTTGRRYTATDAAISGLVDGAASLEKLHGTAVSMVQGLAGKDRNTLGIIKARLFAEATAALLSASSEA